MTLFNFLLNTSRPSFDKRYIFGLLLNSLSSIYCYNHYNYAAMWKDRGTKNHQPSGLRQGLFYFIVFVENLVLTILVLPEAASNAVKLPGLGWAWFCQVSR